MTEPTFSLATGIVIALLVAVVQSLGLTIQRKSLLENEERPPEQRKRDWQRPTWLFGFAVFVLSNTLGSVWQLGALPIVILAPLGGVSLVWNAIFARFILGDHFTRYLIFGTFLIAGGAVLVALFGTVEEPTHTLPELLQLYSRPAFLVWISLLCTSIFVTVLIAHTVELAASREAKISIEKKRRSSTTSRRRRWSSASQTAHSFYSMQTGSSGSAPSSPTTSRFLRRAITIDGEPLPESEDAERLSGEERRRLLLGLAFGGASGSLSGLSLLFAKTSVELLVISVVEQVNQFNKAQPWLILIVLVVAALLSLWYLNRSLRLVGPTLICPTAFCFYNMSAILNGLFYYNQFSRLSGVKIGLVALGVIVLLSGVWVVSLKTSDPISLDNAAPLETTPLLANIVTQEPDDATATEEEAGDRDAEDDLQTRRRLIDLFFGVEDRPRGFSIGIGAASPGFAVRPKTRSHVRSLSIDTPMQRGFSAPPQSQAWYASLAGEPYVGLTSPAEGPKEAEEQLAASTGSLPRRKWAFWKKRRREGGQMGQAM